MSIEDRLRKIEQAFAAQEDPEEIFHRYCSGDYDRSVDFYENLRRAAVPPYAIPEPLPMPELPDKLG
jgi:hypothetical protein